MIGLDTARVVVVDDTADEGLPILEALSTAGIGAAYFSTADENCMPATPLKGIRLMILDLDLIGINSPDIKHTASKVVEIISKDNGPFIIIVWSNHAHEMEGLDVEISKYSENTITPLKIIPLKKEDAKTDGKFDAQKIIKAVKERNEDIFPVDLFTRWEKASHEAATGITSLITQNTYLQAKGDPNKAIEAQNHVITALAKAHLGEKNIQTSGEILSSAFLHAIFPIHEDHLLRNGIKGSSTFFDKLKNSITDETPAKDVIIRLNSSCLITDHDSGSTPPGTIFEVDDLTGEGLQALRSEIIPFTKKQLEIYKCDNDIESNSKAKKEATRESKKGSTVYVELSNACDYAQCKRKSMRLVAGQLIPLNLKKYIISSETFKQIGPIFWNDEPWMLVLNARYLKSASLDSLLDKKIFSLREQAVKECQVWLASYIARPGMLTLTN